MKKTILLFILLITAVFLPAQTAEKLEQLLNTPSVSYGQAAWFILEAADVQSISDNAVIPDNNEAFVYAREKEWLPKNAGPGDIARLEGVSLLLMESFGFKGGIFYSWTKNPHYAYRELVYLGVIQGRIDPKMIVSGDLLFYLVNRVLSILENPQ